MCLEFQISCLTPVSYLHKKKEEKKRGFPGKFRKFQALILLCIQIHAFAVEK